MRIYKKCASTARMNSGVEPVIRGKRNQHGRGIEPCDIGFDPLHLGVITKNDRHVFGLDKLQSLFETGFAHEGPVGRREQGPYGSFEGLGADEKNSGSDTL